MLRKILFILILSTSSASAKYVQLGCRSLDQSILIDIFLSSEPHNDTMRLHDLTTNYSTSIFLQKNQACYKFNFCYKGLDDFYYYNLVTSSDIFEDTPHSLVYLSAFHRRTPQRIHHTLNCYPW